LIAMLDVYLYLIKAEWFIEANTGLIIFIDIQDCAL
jgi:hypothetical protein